MRTPNTLMYLTNVQYLPEKRQIVAEMANKREKLSFRYSFYPKLYLSANPQAEELILELLRAYQNQKFTIQRINSQTIKIECATFSDLKQMAIILQKNLQLPCLVIEPERQFLVEMDWSYFDSFKVNGKAEIISKTNFTIAPKAKLNFIAISLDETLHHLINTEVGKAEDLAGRICLSNILRIKPNEVPEIKAMHSEIMLENIHFSAKIPATSMPHNDCAEHSHFSLNGKHPHLVEFDFSPLWADLCTYPHYNLGIETMNCSCCAPKDIFESNVAPSSKIEVIFRSNYGYLLSNDDKWAREFHEKNPGKEARCNYMKEWKLQKPPAGPFFTGQKARLPLLDAQKLLQEGSIEILKENSAMIWFCNKRESVLSKTVFDSYESLKRIEDEIAVQEKNSLFKHGLASPTRLSKNENYLYRKTLLEKTTELLYTLPIHMLSRNTKFHSPHFAEAFSTIQQDVLSKFNEFGHEEGARLLASTQRKAFVNARYALSLAKAFSARYSLPLPKNISINRNQRNWQKQPN